MTEFKAHPEPERTRRTFAFMGNEYDLAALIALITGAVLLFLCLTCGYGAWCLPVVPLVAGLVGLLSLDRAEDPKRTRLYSWIGIGAGGLSVFLILASIVAYVGLMLWLWAMMERSY
jgi:hypothetical protein